MKTLCKEKKFFFEDNSSNLVRDQHLENQCDVLSTFSL